MCKNLSFACRRGRPGGSYPFLGPQLQDAFFNDDPKILTTIPFNYTSAPSHPIIFLHSATLDFLICFTLPCGVPPPYTQSWDGTHFDIISANALPPFHLFKYTLFFLPSYSHPLLINRGIETEEQWSDCEVKFLFGCWKHLFLSALFFIHMGLTSLQVCMDSSDWLQVRTSTNSHDYQNRAENRTEQSKCLCFL